MPGHDQPHATDYGDAIFNLLMEGHSGSSTQDSQRFQEQIRTDDVVRFIHERLEELNADNGASNGFNLVSDALEAYGGNKDMLGGVATKGMTEISSTHLLTSVGLPIPSRVREWDGQSEATTALANRNREGSVASSTASSSLRGGFDDDLFRGWQPVENNWAPPEPQQLPARRATFDESDFGRYRRRPAWKCKHCDGVGWSEAEPCDGCGRFLPENFQIPRTRPPPMRAGDWICPCCQNMNWEWRTQCNRCHTCREAVIQGMVGDASPGSQSGAPVDDLVKQRLKKRLSTHPAGVFKDNDWVCVSCGNINWDWRVKCHQCSCSKPVVSGGASMKTAPPRQQRNQFPN